MERDGGYEPFEIRGVNLGVGHPRDSGPPTMPLTRKPTCAGSHQIQELGANTIRVYTILHDDFYNAFYDYNTQREAAGAGAAVAHPRRVG